MCVCFAGEGRKQEERQERDNLIRSESCWCLVTSCCSVCLVAFCSSSLFSPHVFVTLTQNSHHHSGDDGSVFFGILFFLQVKKYRVHVTLFSSVVVFISLFIYTYMTMHMLHNVAGLQVAKWWYTRGGRKKEGGKKFMVSVDVLCFQLNSSCMLFILCYIIVLDFFLCAAMKMSNFVLIS